MFPLTATRPKPLQVISGKTLIEWKLLALPEGLLDVILVIGHQGDQIKNHFGDSWGNKRIRYVEQKELNGTAGALLAASSLLGERFLVMMGDDLYAREDIARLLMLDWGMCAAVVKDRNIKGELMVDEKGNFTSINEEMHFVKEGYMNTGLYILRHEILDIPPVPIGGSSAEFGLPHTLAAIAQHTQVPLVITDRWMQITTSEDLVRAEKFLMG